VYYINADKSHQMLSLSAKRERPDVACSSCAVCNRL